jgi:hypothetical protein
MKRSSTARHLRGFVLSLPLLFLAVAGCAREGNDLRLPFKGNSVDTMDCLFFWQKYTDDEEEADRLYKGKVVTLLVCTSPRQPFTDASGEKYVTADKRGSSMDWRQALRCYIYRPDNPIVVVAQRQGEYESWDVMGICEGKVNGIVVLRDCVFRQSWGGGPDW